MKFLARKDAKPSLRQAGAKNLFLTQKIRHGGQVCGSFPPQSA
jgi:hypothetical protein